jgi:hypothetical protein
MTTKTEWFKNSKVKSRRKYSPPRLTNYGSISELTMGGSNIGNDGNTLCNGNANPSTQCNPS